MSKDGRTEQLFEAYGADMRRWPPQELAGGCDAAPAAAEEAREIDHVLALASVPAAPGAAMTRLMARIAAEPRETEVIPLARAARPAAPPARPRLFRFAAAVPLAASLALGAFFGAQGSLDFLLPSAITGEATPSEAGTGELGGADEANAYAEEDLS